MVILQMTLQKLLEWAHLDLNLTKCAITRSPNKPNSNQMYSKPTYKPKISYLKTNPSPPYPKTMLTHTKAYILPLTQMEIVKKTY